MQGTEENDFSVKVVLKIEKVNDESTKNSGRQKNPYRN
jgi:hypothetical protein